MSISKLEAAVQVEQNALEAAYRSGNKISIALYESSLKRALERLQDAVYAEIRAEDARRQEGET